jgi:hypothetical protein
VSGGPRRIMANMLLMSAFEVCNPVEKFILMKTHNFTGDSGHPSSHGFHIRTNLTLRSLSLGGVSVNQARKNYGRNHSRLENKGLAAGGVFHCCTGLS